MNGTVWYYIKLNKPEENKYNIISCIFGSSNNCMNYHNGLNGSAS